MRNYYIYDHGHCKTIGIQALDNQEYQEVYLFACSKFNDVQQRVGIDFNTGLHYGCLICKDSKGV